MKFKIKLYLFIALVIILMCFVGYTYSRYRDETSSDISAEIAPWRIKINDEDISNDVSKNITATPVIDNNPSVMDGKWAPGSTGYIDLIIDPSGTNLSHNIEFNVISTSSDINIEISDLKRCTTTTYNSGCTSISPSGSIYSINKTYNNSAFVPELYRLFLVWDSSNNTNDTTAGSTIDTTNLVSLNVAVTQGGTSNASSQTLSVSHLSNNDYNVTIDYPSTTTNIQFYVDNALTATIKPNEQASSSADFLNRIINTDDMPEAIRGIIQMDDVIIGNQTVSVISNKVFPFFNSYTDSLMKVFIDGNYYTAASFYAEFIVNLDVEITAFNILTRANMNGHIPSKVPCLLVQDSIPNDTWDGNIIVSQDNVDTISFEILKEYFPDNSPISYDINSLTNTSGTHTIKIVAKNGNTILAENSITYTK